jgi:hypothetical protein
VNRFSIVPFDSAWGHYFYDGNNDHRMTSLADYYMVFDPRTWAGEIVRYGDPRFAEADSEYVAEWTLFKDTLDERATKKIKANNANSP